MNQSQLSYINEVLDILEVPVTYKCPYCKNLVTQTYQDKACKACLLQDFKRLRPIIDMTRKISISRYTNQKQAPSPFGRGANTEKSDTNTNCGVRA